ncbi:DUF790 family protein [Salinarchaeum sp. IM2453]|uniref:DUF790 family protein n=1 Tax=Salinarchaeum sp. IM2453 TaxID=2862870 RepID=UPI001C839A6E|nr:DUF790 family protein [Salinarchaeum sp. IM2453]QZA88210.1 DUF790 family protein [Salinarchaeum sp. IM2453]
MLTKELLEVTKRKPNIQPRYRDIDDYQSTAKEVIDVYESGKSRGEIEDAIAELETHDTFKLVRGLSKLLERRVTFEQQAPITPSRVRDAVFKRGIVTSAAERREVIEMVAADLDVTPDEIEDSLWADREQEEILISEPEIGAKELLRQYNLSLTQTLLFDAIEIEFTASNNYQEIFGLMAYLGLMYTVDEDLAVTVTGPTALFKKTRKYGNELAKLLPSIMKADEWSVTAQVETEISDETRIYEFPLNDDQQRLFPSRTTVESFDSEVERDFAARIDSLAEGWTVHREPTILRTGNQVMIPDFSFERNENKFYLEIIGFWTPEYLHKKLEKVRAVESEHPIMLAVNESLNCTKADFSDANVEQVFFYQDTIPVKPVLARLNAIEEREAKQDLQTLKQNSINISTDEITDIKTLADTHDVASDAAERYVAANYDGVISNNKFVPTSVLEKIEAEIDALDNTTLANVNQVLEEYGVAQTVLGHMDYTINYVSLDQSEAKVTKSK